jgi:hypothetical protein
MTDFDRTDRVTDTDKGEHVNRTEHDAKSPAAKTGIFATLRALLRAKRTGAPAPSSASAPAPTGRAAVTRQGAAPAASPQGLTADPTDNRAGSAGRAAHRASTAASPPHDAARPADLPAPPASERLVPPATPAPHRSRRALALAAFAVLAATLILGVALAGAAAPFVTVEDATNVEYTTAHVKGEVDPQGKETSYHFEYITNGKFNKNLSESLPGFEGAESAGFGSLEESAAATPVQTTLEGLHPGSTYHLRLLAENVEGTAEAVASATFTTEATTFPQVELDPITTFTATTAHFSGHINPEAPAGDPAAFDVRWRFDYRPEGASASSSTPTQTLPAGQSSEEVQADVSGLIPNTHYIVELAAENAGSGEIGSAHSFDTPAIGPDATLATSTEATPTGVVVNGTVNPHNSPLTDCHFAYGLGAGLDHSAPCEGTLPSGDGVANVKAQLTGLAPGTGYSVRLVAANSVGSVETATGHFGTPTGGGVASCPNEAIRIAQHATQTGDCRAWEQVSPAEKGGGDIVAEAQSIVASADGDRAVFDSRYTFGDTVGAGAAGHTTYLAHRTDGGWATRSITPASRPEPVQVFAGSTGIETFSSDLSRSLVFGYDLPGATGDAPERENLYLQDNATGALRTISSSQRGDGEDPIQFNADFSGGQLWGVSEDLSHVSFVSNTQWLPTGTAPGYPQGTEFANPRFRYAFTKANAYTWDDGTLHLAGILPDGSLPPEGSGIEPGGVNEGGGPGTMSPDGSRQTFEAAPTEGAPRQLYLRIDHSRTALVSESENEAFTEEAQGVVFEGMTPDGKNVFFVTDSPLLEADENSGPDLYRWTEGPDPEHEDNLTLITHNGGAYSNPGDFGGALIGMSDDATRVYVHDSGGFLELWEEGSGIKTLAEVPRGIEAHKHLTFLSTQPGFGRVSRDGDWMAYIKGSADQNVLHLYDRQRDTDTKIAEHTSLVPLLTAPNGGGKNYYGFRPRFLSADDQVFFTSTDALLPGDTNGVADVYSYDGPTGRLSLVTSGRGDEPMEFADASADGRNVFFVTRAQLVPSDTDHSADLYDARVGGGFDEPEASPVRPCSGEACQGGSGGSVSSPAIGSAAATRGNLKQRHHKPRKHHKHHKRHHRTAAHNRGGGK